MKSIMSFALMIMLFGCGHQDLNQKKIQAYKSVEDVLDEGPLHRAILSSEGEWVQVFSPQIAPFVSEKLTGKKIDEVKKILGPSLEIGLTDRGFVQAAVRALPPGVKDETNYDAVWIRDCGWVLFHFLESGQKTKARKLALALWDYYSSPKQLERLKNVIQKPQLALEGTMNVPHIRFNGKSKNFEDVFLDGRPQVWNHRQNDAHGIFLSALAQSFLKGVVRNRDFNRSRALAVKQLFRFLDAIDYHNYPGAGAWEEISKVNTSSVAMVVRALENWSRLARKRKKLSRRIGWSSKRARKMIANGYRRIRKNLYLGGESAEHPPLSQEFRREDAALFNLFLPAPLERLNSRELFLAQTILEKLIRPFGVIRYRNDSYQSGNYWVHAPGMKPLLDGPSETGDSSSADDFKKRFSKFIPDSEAQWFFDSKLAMIYAGLNQRSKGLQKRRMYQKLAHHHLKRALGQVTGSFESVDLITADGVGVRELQIPESINTVVVEGRRHYLPSPITPLNWAKASLSMALERVKRTRP